MRKEARKKTKRKLDKTGWGIVTIVIAIAVVLAGWLTYRAVQVARLSRQVDVKVDGTKELKSGKASAKLLAKYEAAQPADLLTSQTAAKKRSAVLVFAGLTDSQETNEKILDYLKKAGVSAAFALPAARARENDVMIKDLVKSRQQLIGSGIMGTEGSQAAEVLLPKLQLAKKSLEAESRQEIKLLYLPGKADYLAKAAATCGYEALVCPENSDLLDRQTFTKESQVKNYVQQLSGQRIIVVNLAGLKGPVHQEPAVKVAKPALDKQAQLADQQKKSKKELEIDQVVRLLLQDLKEEKIPCQPLSSLKPVKSSSYIKAQLADDDQQATLYRYSLTNKKKVALVIGPLHQESSYRKFKKVLVKAGIPATFLSDEKTQDALIKQIKEAGYDLQLASQTALTNNWTAYQTLKNGQERLAKTSKPAAYVLKKSDESSAVRRACWQTDLTPVAQNSAKELKPGRYIFFKAGEAGKMAAFAKQGKKAGYSFTTLASLVKNPAIKALSQQEIAKMRKENQGQKDQPLTQVLTTEPALSLLLTNLSHSAVDQEVGQIVKDRGGSATFAASFGELQDESLTIEQLLKEGHELALVYQESKAFPATFKGASQYLHNCLEYCQWRFNYQPKLVVVSGKKSKAGVLEAIKAAKLTAIAPKQALIKAKSQDSTFSSLAKNRQEVAKLRFNRGAIEGINLGYYEADQVRQKGEKTVMGQMVQDLLKDKLDAIAYHPRGKKIEAASRYKLKTVSQLKASKACYSFNDKKSQLVEADKRNLTKLKPYWREFAYLEQHYVGSNFVTSPVKMPGFDYWETNRLDQVGRLTNDRVLFLTFDDWGSDESINKILYVLKKHHVKATFF
ncbi:polysaccharide deacetylase family protein, partial [Lactobacillus sp.]|uniref:polysaccharide deacetylase family protein n=1 Tax=Lactobacillus sp. TaxID=1591 RepID=UPI003EFFA719